MKNALRFLSVIGLLASNAWANAPLPTVESVELSRYLGRWYEVVRAPNSFQKNCANSTADYSLRDDGDIKVLNQCEKANGKIKDIVGKAWVVDKTTNAKLKVQFFWPFSGDYWILALDEDYQTVMVGEPSRKFLWIMSRTPNIDPVVRDTLVLRAKNLGFNTTNLIYRQN